MSLQGGQLEIRWWFSAVYDGSASSGTPQKRQFLKFKIFEYMFYLFNVRILSISMTYMKFI